MGKIKQWLNGKKTYLTAVGGILAAAVAYANGSLDTVEAAKALFEAFGLIFVRLGVAKSLFGAALPKDAMYTNPAKGLAAGQPGE